MFWYKMNLGIIGCGAIGTDVAIAANKMEEINKIYLYDIDKKSKKIYQKSLKNLKLLIY